MIEENNNIEDELLEDELESLYEDEHYSCYSDDDEPSDGYLTDAEADADALASAGHGDDEHYNHWDYGSGE